MTSKTTESENHPLSEDETAAEQLVNKPSTESSQDSKPEERHGIFQSCQWFSESPMARWQFALFLGFGVSSIIWIIIRLSSSLSADIIAGVVGLILALYGARHFRILLGLKVEVDRYGKLNENFKEENQKLHREVDRLSRAHDELAAIQQRLQETTKGYAENIEKFRNIDETLRKLAEDNIEGVEKLKELSQHVQESMHDELVQHERDILHKVMEALELQDSKEGLNEQEYNKFIGLLPLSFQRRFSNMNKTFDEISGPDDILDIEDFRKLADEFAVQEAKAGGSHA